MCRYCNSSLIEKAVEMNDVDFFDAGVIAASDVYDNDGKIRGGWYLMGSGDVIRERNGKLSFLTKSVRVNYCPVCGRKL